MCARLRIELHRPAKMLDGFHVVWIPIDPLVLRFPLPAPEWPAGTAWLLLSIAGLGVYGLARLARRESRELRAFSPLRPSRFGRGERGDDS